MVEIPLSKPDITTSDIQAVEEVLLSGKLSLGPMQEAFEKKFADFCGVKHAVSVSSGTAALHLAVELAGIQEEDEVIVSPFSFIASSNVVLYQKARPVFVDIEEVTLGIDPQLIEEKILSKTKAILPTHVFGQSCRINEIYEIAKKHNLTLIEDNCESLGASIESNQSLTKTGTLGQFATYGFYPNKLITTGEGGMLTIDSDEIAKRARSLRNQGRSTMAGMHLVHEQLGYNYRMSDIQAALGQSQLERIDQIITRREILSNRYDTLFSGMEDILLPSKVPGFNPVWFVYYIRVSSDKRDKLIDFLNKKGIQCRAYFYPPIHLQPFYIDKFGFKEGDFPIAEKVSKQIIALPFYNNLTYSEMDRVVENVQLGLKEV